MANQYCVDYWIIRALINKYYLSFSFKRYTENCILKCPRFSPPINTARFSPYFKPIDFISSLVKVDEISHSCICSPNWLGRWMSTSSPDWLSIRLAWDNTSVLLTRILAVCIMPTFIAAFFPLDLIAVFQLVSCPILKNIIYIVTSDSYWWATLIKYLKFLRYI